MILPPARRGTMKTSVRPLEAPHSVESDEVARPGRDSVSPIQGMRWTGNFGTAQPGVYRNMAGLDQANAVVSQDSDTGRYNFRAEHYSPDTDQMSAAHGSFTTRTPFRARAAATSLVKRLAHQSAGRTI